MAAEIPLYILSDGSFEFWTVPLDAETPVAKRADAVLKTVLGIQGNVDDYLVVRQGSLGSRATQFPTILIESLRSMDGGSNIQRY